MSSEDELGSIGTVFPGSPIDKSIGSILPQFDEEVETLLEDSFTWNIPDWNELTNPKYNSPRFRIGDFEWDILLFPQGNHNKGVAVYLEPHPEEKLDETTGEMVPVDPDWYCCAQFAIGISRPGNGDTINLINKSHHRFNALDTDWGFANLIDLNNLKHPSKGRPLSFLNEGTLNITAYVRILKDPTGVLWHNFLNYDSKKVTGYVGFRNQGATCYLNSLLQSYFFTKYFRKLVYEIPTEHESPNNSVPLALQRAFYQLQVSDIPLDTLELTRSFGWDTAESFTQHDVQELNRILMDRLENNMKGTPVEGKLNEIFVGKMKSYIKCINVDYESARVEDFWDLQLNVKNFKNLQESFDNYIEMELMNGENQYAAQDYGLQDAQKGVIFESFPPVLHLQLKRFEYDFNYDQMVKVNDKYEFPETIDLSPFVDKDVLKKTLDSENKDKNPYVYNLHGVLVHSGDISTGHYYTLIKPGVEDQWYRFDDERVWRVTKKQVFQENFGCDRLPDGKVRTMTRDEYQNYIIQRHTSAYMLVYIRQEQEEDLLRPVLESDVPKHVITRVREEIKERETKEKEIREAHLYVTLRLHSIKEFIHYEGFDYFAHDGFRLFAEELNDSGLQQINLKVLRTTKLSDIFASIKETMNIPQERDVKYWKMDYRRNSTLRLTQPINFESVNITLQEALKKEKKRTMQTQYGEEGVASTEEDDKALLETVSFLDLFIEEPYLELQFLNKLKEASLISKAQLDDELISTIRTNLPELTKGGIEPVFATDNKSNLLFVKSYDPHTQKLLGFGHFAVNQLQQLSDISAIIEDSISSNEKLTFYEEVQPGTINEIYMKETIYDADIDTGDIVSFEVPGAVLPDTFPVYATIKDFYSYLRYRVKLKFSKFDGSSKEYGVSNEIPESFEFWISAYAPYDDLARMVSKYAHVKPEYLKIFALYSNGRFVLKSTSLLNDYLLKDFNCDQIPPFAFEVLSVPLKELERLRPIKLYWLKNSYIHYQCFEFEVANDYTESQFLEKVQHKIGFTDEEKENILLWTNTNFQFQGLLSDQNTFKDVSKHSLLFGRILPEESKLFKELNRLENVQTSSLEDFMDDENATDRPMDDEQDLGMAIEHSEDMKGRIVVVQQYFKDLENRHGISFLFNLIPDETFPKTKDRLHAKFGLGQKEFSKIKLSIGYSTEEGTVFRSLQGFSDEELDKVILYDIMSNLDYIYMDHPDRLRSHSSYDRPMIIKN